MKISIKKEIVYKITDEKSDMVMRFPEDSLLVNINSDLWSVISKYYLALPHYGIGTSCIPGYRYVSRKTFNVKNFIEQYNVIGGVLLLCDKSGRFIDNNLWIATSYVLTVNSYKLCVPSGTKGQIVKLVGKSGDIDCINDVQIEEVYYDDYSYFYLYETY